MNTNKELRESLLWTASSLAAVGKEQDVIVLEGRKRTIGEILDEANAALDMPDSASPASTVATEGEKDEQAAFAAWHTREFGSFPSDVTNHYNRWLGWKGRASVAAPAAGDALQFLADTEGAIESLMLEGRNTLYRVWWPTVGEFQTEWYASPQEAVDAAIAAQQGKVGAA